MSSSLSVLSDLSGKRQSINTCEKIKSPVTPVVALPAPPLVLKILIESGSSATF